eukprot:NODE_31516_length_395_cov_0.854478.p3 GENE.NODE_31516_length_395_cov_0.854478~~NODE_31516_length_395_cov_0.854478.p3  ORF type:complete len:51 (-),score=14.94 NODE_31516_length_395_cov_0.854478:75-227(-)
MMGVSMLQELDFQRKKKKKKKKKFGVNPVNKKNLHHPTKKKIKYREFPHE